MATLRKQQKAETRRRVLDAAYALFEERGYEGTTMREIAARASIAAGTIFTHFPDKRALVVAAFHDDVLRAADDAWASLPDDLLLVRLVHVVRELYRFYADRPAVSRVLVEQSLFAQSEHRTAMDRMIVEFLFKVAGLYASAAERGEIAKREDWMEVALGFWSDYFIGLVAGLRQDSFDVEGHAALVGRLFEQRIRGLARGGPG